MTADEEKRKLRLLDLDLESCDPQSTSEHRPLLLHIGVHPIPLRAEWLQVLVPTKQQNI